jgi:hypothetical protein
VEACFRIVPLFAKEFQIENFPFFVKGFRGKKTKVFFLFVVPGNSGEISKLEN